MRAGATGSVQSIKAALRDRESSGPETALSEAVVTFFGAPSVEAVAARVYSQPLTKSEIAAFATETAKLAEAGDGVARELYELGARELAAQVAVVIAQTGLARGAAADRSFPVGLIGSVFKTGAIFVEPLAAAIERAARPTRACRSSRWPRSAAACCSPHAPAAMASSSIRQSSRA